MAQTWFELGLFMFAGFAIVGGAWAALASYSQSDWRYWGALLFGAVLLVGTVWFVGGTLSRRTALITRGRLRLPRPARRADGRPVRWIRLSEVTGANPSFGLSGDDGVDLILVDRTELFLPRRAFGRRGIEVMEWICGGFGSSFRGGMKRLTREGYLVASLKVDGRKGDMIALTAPLFTYSGYTKNRIRPVDVSRVERIKTRLAGDAYEVELLDGTVALLSGADANRIAIWESPAWAAKANRT